MSTLGKRQISDMITCWFHTKSVNNLSPSNTVSIVLTKFAKLCTYRNLNFSVSLEQLKESISEATCVMYYAKRVCKDWDGPHRKFTYPSNWSTDYERYWEEMLDNFVFTDELWDCFWRPLNIEACENDIPSWKQNMQIILPQYILRETEVLKMNGMVLETKHIYIHEKTNEHVYEEEDYDD